MSSTSSAVLSARGRAGVAAKSGDPVKIESAYRDLAAEKIAAYIERVVAEAPALSTAQKDRLATLLRTAPAEPRTIRRPRAVDEQLATPPDDPPPPRHSPAPGGSTSAERSTWRRPPDAHRQPGSTRRNDVAESRGGDA